MITKELKTWLLEAQMDYTITGDNKISIEGIGNFIELIQEGDIIDTKEDQTLSLIITKEIVQEILELNVDYIIYQFGGLYYYTPISLLSDLLLTPFRSLGKSIGWVKEDTPVFLGVHGRYEQMSGVKDYSDWCKRAKFLGYKYLGICERHTLSGTLPFQLTCAKSGITPIFGYTLDIEGLYDIRIFAINEQGWQRLLEINKWINVDGLEVKQDFLLQDNSSLIAILPPGLKSYKNNFYKAYFQITSNEYLSEKKDAEFLQSMQEYLNGKIDLPPILLSDAYCVEKSEVHIKRILNKQGNKHSVSTDKHYLKSMDQEFDLLAELFKDEDTRLEELFDRCMDSLKEVSELCKFQINTKELFLPQYEMTKEEIELYGDEVNMFNTLIVEGLKRKIGKDVLDDPIVIERLDTEMDLIEEGGFISYFLILWDILQFCDREKIEYGTGRGSAAGSLVAYAFNIVKINPLEYDLLFQRFLNPERIKSEMPDIDTDYASDRKDDVIKYVKERYGEDYVCQVGTYGTLQMRGAIKEMARAHGIQGTYNINVISALIDQKVNGIWEGIFYEGATKPTLKNFIKDNADLINDCAIVLNAIKSTSIHASAVIIVPKNGKTIYQQIPVRKDGDLLISEWEGNEMATAGYLKEDILSTKQVAKIGHIIDLIEEHTGNRIDVQKIDLDCPEVFEMFCQGYTQDVFQFNTPLATHYLKQMKPSHVNDLIATTALLRPGAMGSGSHTEYVKLKHGEKEIVYDWGTEPATKDTYGIMVYQEQIMRVVMDVAGFSPADSEGVRKATGKKLKDKMDSYRIKFIDGAIKNGCPKNEAINIWNKMESFSFYSFNRSHAACYSLIGYFCNWFKYKYPLEFWTTAFQYAGDHQDILNYIIEIKKTGSIKIQTPDINKSGLEFYSSVKDNTIYWNLNQIKFVGPGVANSVIEERKANGPFFSIEEFAERVVKREVNKRSVENMIVAGCFDQLHNVKRFKDRWFIIKEYYEKMKIKEQNPLFEINKDIEYFWSLKQGEVTGYSTMDYAGLIKLSNLEKYSKDYISCEEFMLTKDMEGEAVVIAGNLSEVQLRATKKDKNPYITGYLIQEDQRVPFKIWSQELNCTKPEFKGIEKIAQAEGRLCILRGTLKFNNWETIMANELTMNSRLSGNVFQLF